MAEQSVTETTALAAAAIFASVQSAPTQDSPVADAVGESSVEAEVVQKTVVDPAPVDVSTDTDASEEPQGEPAPATAESAKKKDRRGRRASGPRRAAAAAAPADRPLPAAAPVGRRRILHKGRTIGAVLAIATLVGGTALPALGLGQTGGATAAATASLADAQSQSLTVDSEALPKVEIRGDFSATTPAELAEIQAVAAAAARSGVNPIAKPGQVIIPMAAGSYTMTDGYGASRPGRSHMGQDYAAPIGTPIYAAADGVVTMSQDSYGGYGVTVQVKHDQLGSNAVSTLYGHMDYDTRAVEVGEHVVAGQFLGRVGNTGYTIGSCLHFEVRISGSPIDPVPWLKTNVR